MKNLKFVNYIFLSLCFFSSTLSAEVISIPTEGISKIEITIYPTISNEGVKITTDIDSKTIKKQIEVERIAQAKSTLPSIQQVQNKLYFGSGFVKVKKDYVASLLVGYELPGNFAIEGGLLTSAEVYSINSTNDASSGLVDGKAWSISANAGGLKASTNTSYMLGINHSIPLNNIVDITSKVGLNKTIDFTSKLGILFWGVDYSLYLDGTITFDGTTYTPSGSIPFASDQGSNVYYGLGLSYPLTDKVSIRTEYTKTKIADNDVGGFTAVALFQF
jgi:opacity protein-like surface antigen